MTTPHSTDLTVSHFIRREDGTFVAPTGSIATLTPIGQFFKLCIAVNSHIAVTAVVHRTALKTIRGGCE